jgi:hypothetical protein
VATLVVAGTARRNVGKPGATGGAFCSHAAVLVTIPASGQFVAIWRLLAPCVAGFLLQALNAIDANRPHGDFQLHNLDSGVPRVARLVKLRATERSWSPRPFGSAISDLSQKVGSFAIIFSFILKVLDNAVRWL